MDDATGDQYIVNTNDAWPDYTHSPAYNRFAEAAPMIEGHRLMPQYGGAAVPPRPLTNPPYTRPRLAPVGPQRPVAAYTASTNLHNPQLDEWEQLYRWGQYGIPARIITAPPVPPSLPTPTQIPLAAQPQLIYLVIFMFAVLILWCVMCTRALSKVSAGLKKIGKVTFSGGGDSSCQCGCCNK